MNLRLCVLLLGFCAGYASAQATEKKNASNFSPVFSTTIADALGDVSLVSHQGKPFVLLQKPDQAQKPTLIKHRFLVQGGLHGDEELSPHFVKWLALRYASGLSPLNDLGSPGVVIDFLPISNPDGVDQRTRTNSRGVNLNRNFDVLWGLTSEFPGTSSFSEPESVAIARLVQKRAYTAAVDVHGYVNWIVAPSGPGAITSRAPSRRLDAGLVERYTLWMEALRKELSSLNGYELKTAASLGDGGSFEDWAFWQMGTMAFCLELETFQRFLPQAEQGLFLSWFKREPRPIDTFLRYEAFIAGAFRRAIKIRDAEAKGHQIAASAPAS